MKNSDDDKRKFLISPINIDEAGEEYIIYIAVPGVERENINVIISNGELIVSAKKKELQHDFMKNPDADCSHWKESFMLPVDADTLMTAAICRNGELQIHIPKAKINKGEIYKPLKKEMDLYIY
ncbi:MAG TPA: Hsp20/alpha crystallin family protein [Chitinophagaceae bacterium]|nr:Hsp20/alpha crystallin family protein [Chitinophagaceae bacterium]